MSHRFFRSSSGSRRRRRSRSRAKRKSVIKSTLPRKALVKLTFCEGRNLYTKVMLPMMSRSEAAEAAERISRERNIVERAARKAPQEAGIGR